MKTTSAPGLLRSLCSCNIVARCTTVLMLGAGISSAGTLGEVKGPLPVTETSRPWLASGHTQTSVDLEAAGYVEEEFILGGTANIY